MQSSVFTFALMIATYLGGLFVDSLSGPVNGIVCLSLACFVLATILAFCRSTPCDLSQASSPERRPRVTPGAVRSLEVMSRTSVSRGGSAIESREESVLAEPIIEEARTLLDRASVLREPADFDLLVFFARHPRTLLPSESLGALLGYELKDIARSLEALLQYGLLQRTQTSAHAARLYVLAAEAPPDWFPPLLEMAASRTGRLALRQLLANRPREKAVSRPSPNTEEGATGRRSVVLRMPPDTHGEQNSDAKAG